MSNKVIATILGILSLMFLLFAAAQFFKYQEVVKLYQSIGNPVPPELYFAPRVWIIPAAISLFFTIKFFKKK